MQMNTQGGGVGGNLSQHRPGPFTLSEGKAWDGEAKRKEGNKRKIMAASFHMQCFFFFPVIAGQLPLSPTIATPCQAAAAALAAVLIFLKDALTNCLVIE